MWWHYGWSMGGLLDGSWLLMLLWRLQSVAFTWCWFDLPETSVSPADFRFDTRLFNMVAGVKVPADFTITSVQHHCRTDAGQDYGEQAVRDCDDFDVMRWTSGTTDFDGTSGDDHFDDHNGLCIAPINTRDAYDTSVREWIDRK